MNIEKRIRKLEKRLARLEDNSDGVVEKVTWYPPTLTSANNKVTLEGVNVKDGNARIAIKANGEHFYFRHRFNS